MRGVPEDPRLRRMALATLVNTTGNGIFFTLSALYFTRIVGLSVTQVGLGLSIARQLARGLGGELRYAPRGGGGAEFILELP